ncbi:MAG TPA: ATP-binding protein [Acidimicrobiales bacterium]|nr:ATP-binding protein [Acidimicrobiales bacterium]
MSTTGHAASAGTEDLDPRDLAAALLGEEERRTVAARQADEVELLGDDELLGVGGTELSLRQVLGVGGLATVGLLLALNLVGEVDGLTLSVLAPDIQHSFHLDDAALTFVSTIGAVALFVATVPFGLLGDRRRRSALIALTSVLWGAASLATGAVQSAWQFASVRAVNGFGKGTGPVGQSILSDRYPIEGRNRVFALYSVASYAGPAFGPILAAIIATVAGGPNGWRWAFVVLGIPAMVLGLLALRLPDPERGTNELDGLVAELRARGEAGDPEALRVSAALADAPAESALLAAEPIGMAAAYDRMKKIKTFAALMSAMSALGFMLSGAPIIFNVFLQDHYHLSAIGRGTVASIASLGGLVGVAVGAPFADRLFRRDPSKVLLLVGGLLAVFPLMYVPSLYMPKVWMLVAFQVPGAICLFSPALCGAMLASIVPYRMRGFGLAVMGLYAVGVGGLIGAVTTGVLADAVGTRTALSIVVPIGCVGAALFAARASGSVRHDMSLVVEEMREEIHEAARQRAAGTDDHFLQVRNLDFSYGSVQVLFDIDLEVARGETLALLGTNGAGKSTLLRAISGLSLPDRGVIRLGGSPITYLPAKQRVQRGVIQVPGGRAVFPTMTVEENLLVGATSFVWDHERLAAKTERVLELFPDLRALLGQPAGTLSGGEQQMLALAKALLLDPQILLIDELSLGLAPVVVQRIVEVVQSLKAQGITLVVVEQSINVALMLADRAVFMEKGRIRYDGPTSVLLESGDLARAVFLGEEFG